VDLAGGKAVVLPAGKKSFDPAKIPEAIRKAGFSAPKVEIMVTGTVEKWKDMLALRVPGQTRVFVLEGGKQLEEFRKTATLGKQVQLTGLLHRSHGDSPPGLTVEQFK